MRALAVTSLALCASVLFGCGGPACPDGYLVDHDLGYCVSADAGLDAGLSASDAGGGDAGWDAGSMVDAAPLDAGGDADAGRDAGPPTTRAEFVHLLRDAVCTKAIYCASQDTHAPLTYCHSGAFTELVGADGSPGAAFHAAAIPGCLAVLEAASWQHVCAKQSAYLDPACRAVLTGGFVDGTTCASDFQCTGFCDRGSFTHTCGTCRVPLGAGSSCVSETACMSGLACTLHGCGTLGDVGAPCAFSLDCAADFACNSTGHCQSTPAGAPCVVTSPDECAGDLLCTAVADGGVCGAGGGVGSICDDLHPCGPARRCDATHVCTVLAGPGESCTASTECTPYFRCLTGVCQPQPDVGGACGATLPCRTGGCVGGTCAPLPDGSSCTGPAECAGRCVAGTCAPKLADGAACVDDVDCLAASACTGATTRHCSHCP